MNGLSMYAKNSTLTYSMAEIVEQHAILVKRIAYHLIARLPHTVEVDDLIQTGMIGLLDAAQHYDTTQ
ncbi:MAG: RNA polymerase sigma factor FliA, partial [Pseudomonadota bacterium]|nr:RNA polymerase sigma factor FliA [Pseudomonadota bacterium]